MSNVSNTKVAVRVRPFNKQEEAGGSNQCISIKESNITVQSGGQVCEFSYDYCYSSYDKNQEFNDQQKVYDGIGRDLLKSAWDGYNCCLLAYGQSRTGKPYTMFGTESQRGIVYRFCDELFKNIESSQLTHEVWISVCEINLDNKIQDRLTTDSINTLVLKERAAGVYIPDLQMHLVKNYKEIEQIIETGVHNQYRQNFLFNRSTSGSNLIIVLELRQIIDNNHRVSKIQIVDIEGSEKRTLVSSQNQLECKVSKTINALQQVITNLAARNGAYIPFRESALTRILQNSLQGNCKNYMICTITPASKDLFQTLSTLRLANEARKIFNRVSINQFLNTIMIDNQYQELIQLKEQIEMLLQQLTNKNTRSTELLQQINELTQQCIQQPVSAKDVCRLQDPP